MLAGSSTKSQNDVVLKPRPWNFGFSTPGSNFEHLPGANNQTVVTCKPHQCEQIIYDESCRDCSFIPDCMIYILNGISRPVD